jgi:L-threonylcarbamoyladenylate synthase
MNNLYREDLLNATHILKKGGVILYPTDTIWGLGCDATNESAVKKIFDIKQRPPQKSFIILVNSFEMLENYVEWVPPIARELITQISTPLTIVYPKGKNVAPSLQPPDKSIAIRLTRDPFCLDLISQFGKPIVSTSANLSGFPPPKIFKEIDPNLLTLVDYVVKYRQDDLSHMKPSTIIRIIDDWNYEILRQ